MELKEEIMRSVEDAAARIFDTSPFTPATVLDRLHRQEQSSRAQAKVSAVTFDQEILGLFQHMLGGKSRSRRDIEAVFSAEPCDGFEMLQYLILAAVGRWVLLGDRVTLPSLREHDSQLGEVYHDLMSQSKLCINIPLIWLT